MPVVLKNNATAIEVDISAGLKHYVQKGDFDVVLSDTGLPGSTGIVIIVMRSKAVTENYIFLDWREVSDPVFNSAEELRDTILSWNIQQAMFTTVTKIGASATNVLLLAANNSRKRATVYNNGLKNMFIKYGADATEDSFSLKIGPGDYLELPTPCYLGEIDAFWDEVDGNAMVTEIT
jgi:hypothetical protein